jgi:hypothetical protein
MPLSPERRAWVCAYLKYFVFREAFCPPEAIEDALALQVADVQTLVALIRTRYLNARVPVPKNGNLDLAWAYAQSPAHHHRFVQMLRVSPTTFDVLHDLIRNHPAFYNNSPMPQAPVPVQLALTLWRLGRHGNAASVMDAARMAGISEGSVHDFTRRCFQAILPLHNQFVRPLTPAEKAIEKQWVEQHSGIGGEFKEGWVMYDGTIVVLYRRPDMDGDGYYTRKANYGLNLQVRHSTTSFVGQGRTEDAFRLAMSPPISVSLITRTVIRALLMTLLLSAGPLLTAIRTGSFLATSLPGQTQHTTSPSVLFLCTSGRLQTSRRMLSLIRLPPISEFALSTPWAHSKAALAACEVYK